MIMLFFFTSIHCGKETIKVSKALEKNISENEIKNTDWRGNQEVGWFISDFVLTIGMIGTVSGFLLMLNRCFCRSRSYMMKLQ